MSYLGPSIKDLSQLTCHAHREGRPQPEHLRRCGRRVLREIQERDRRRWQFCRAQRRQGGDEGLVYFLPMRIWRHQLLTLDSGAGAGNFSAVGAADLEETKKSDAAEWREPGKINHI